MEGKQKRKIASSLVVIGPKSVALLGKSPVGKTIFWSKKFVNRFLFMW